jgi:hypothetical protein
MNEGPRLVTLTERLARSSEAVYGTEVHELVLSNAVGLSERPWP